MTDSYIRQRLAEIQLAESCKYDKKIKKKMDMAASIIQRAVEKDKNEQYTMALLLYQEGLAVLIDYIKGVKDPIQKKQIHARAAEYMDRAERIKSLIEEKKKLGKYREILKIEEGSKGHGYNNVFGRFLDNTVTHIHVDDPYVIDNYQIFNFLRFCELAVLKCQSLSKICLATKKDDKGKHHVQKQNLEILQKSLTVNNNINLDIQYSNTLHDRQIILNNGWIIKIGRGLHYFKPVQRFELGFCDNDLKPCYETTVDIFHQNQIKENTI